MQDVHETTRTVALQTEPSRAALEQPLHQLPLPGFCIGRCGIYRAIRSGTKQTRLPSMWNRPALRFAGKARWTDLGTQGAGALAGSATRMQIMRAHAAFN